MGLDAASAAARQRAEEGPLLTKFARLLKDRHSARLYLFGSRARGTAGVDSDYDVVVVSPRFQGQRWLERPAPVYALWFEAGGWGTSVDLQCYTQAEFRREVLSLGYLGSAKRRGELVRVRVPRAGKEVLSAAGKHNPAKLISGG